jgi:hypothetical protein
VFERLLRSLAGQETVPCAAQCHVLVTAACKTG